VLQVLDDQRRAISRACERHGVVRLDLFGSALRADFRHGDSDVDLLVEFQAMTPHDLVDAYFGLTEDLTAVLGRPVDLVMKDAVKNPYIAREIERSKRLLYAA
jgi:uncharacterized protein